MGRDDWRTNFEPFTEGGCDTGEELGGGEAIRTGTCRVAGWVDSEAGGGGGHTT